jgi:hypothetical protein
LLSRGAVGLVLTDQHPDDCLGRELVVDARPSIQRVTLTTDGPQPPRRLRLRNGASQPGSDGTLVTGVLRSSA